MLEAVPVRKGLSPESVAGFLLRLALGVLLFFAASPVWTATLLVDGVTLFVGGGLVLGIGLLWELVLHFFVPLNVGMYIVEEPGEAPETARRASKDGVTKRSE